ncbi:hypothetical protein JCM3263A_21410 [Thermobifida fusca]|nr:hypothetical protein [Thermobifida sp.]PPS94999.1 hypothetical protein BH05_04425 [Thermobifida fusca]PZN65838.1 MAG: hypothetical protein DIU53_03005 [Thermobifida fusca]
MTVNMDTRGMHTEPRTQGTLPHATKPEDLLAEHERGLYLVEQLATTWGTLAPTPRRLHPPHLGQQPALRSMRKQL